MVRCKILFICNLGTELSPMVCKHNDLIDLLFNDYNCERLVKL